jgi:hypothetical protein
VWNHLIGWIPDLKKSDWSIFIYAEIWLVDFMVLDFWLANFIVPDFSLVNFIVPDFWLVNFIVPDFSLVGFRGSSIWLVSFIVPDFRLVGFSGVSIWLISFKARSSDWSVLVVPQSDWSILRVLQPDWSNLRSLHPIGQFCGAIFVSNTYVSSSHNYGEVLIPMFFWPLAMTHRCFSDPSRWLILVCWLLNMTHCDFLKF